MYIKNDRTFFGVNKKKKSTPTEMQFNALTNEFDIISSIIFCYQEIDKKIQK